MLGILALTNELRSVKMEMMVNRIAHRLPYLKEETLWKRLRELLASRQQDSRPQGPETLRSKAELTAHRIDPGRLSRASRPRSKRTC